MLGRKADPVLPAVSFALTELQQLESVSELGLETLDEMELVDPGRPGKLQCFDPATMQRLGEVELMSRERVEETVAAARAAQVAWAQSSFAERRAVMRAVLEYYVEHMEDVVRVCCRDSGKTRLCAVLGEVTPTCEKLRWILGAGEAVLRPEQRGGQGLLTLHKAARVEFVPLGVLGVLAPFNYPGHNLLNHVISGLFSGNAVVTKVSEYTAWSAAFLARPVQEALVSAGYSADLVQLVTGTAEAGAALVESAGVDKVIFTGSDRVGRLVMRGAAANLTPVVLELGGKDPFVVCEDADLAVTVPIALRGVFQNAGQNCIGVERLFVHADVHDDFVQRCHARVAQMVQSAPLGDAHADVGALTMPGALANIQRLVDDAVAKGATLVCGGERNAALAPGQFYKPTILTGVSPDMLIATEEVFGPVMTFAVPWTDEAALIAAVNDCPYALGSSVFAGDAARAERIGANIDAGMLNVNDFGISYCLQSLPFGGRKSSGFAKFAGPEGLRACCMAKAVATDRIPGVRTALPPPFVYPTALDAHTTAANLVRTAYSPTIWAKVVALVGLLKGIFKPLRPLQADKKLD